MSEDFQFTGYPIELENRDWLQQSSTELLFSSRDYEAPEEVDPRSRVRHDQQGAMGSCAAFANTNCAENIWAMHYGNQWSNERQFSQLFSYLLAQAQNGLLGRDQGSTIEAGVKVAMTIGYLPAEYLPYKTPYPSNARTLITDEMKQLASPYKVRSHTWLESYEGVFNYLASGTGSVFLGHSWNNSCYASNGVLESISLGSGSSGHAVSFLGYSRRKDSKGRNYIWRLNSHRDSWTEIAPSVVDQIAKHRWSSIVGISDLSTPGPRKVSWVKERPLG